jgi:glycosyltransferase involved in cell wall biosynthesis
MQDIVKKHGYECYVLPNQVDTSIYKNNLNREVKGTFRLVMVCAIRQAKRLDMAFKAIHKLINEGMDIHLDIIGDGFYENIYKQKCTEEGMEEYVSFLGRKNKEGIAKIFLSEHALLISSELESFAIPGIEALASGLPVISTACGGPKDFITDKTGVLTKVNDIDDIAKGIKKVYKNYNKYKKEDLEKMAKCFDEKKIVRVAKELYEIAIKK